MTTFAATSRYSVTCEPLLTSAEVAVMFRVGPDSVRTWARDGLLPSVRTPGGHRRYREADVTALLGATLRRRNGDTP